MERNERNSSDVFLFVCYKIQCNERIIFTAINCIKKKFKTCTGFLAAFIAQAKYRIYLEREGVVGRTQIVKGHSQLFQSKMEGQFDTHEKLMPDWKNSKKKRKGSPN